MESPENQERQPQANQPAAESSDVSSLSKTETIKLLNDSIDRLEATIKGIKANDSNKLPSSNSIDEIVTTTQKLADAVTSPPPPSPPSVPQPAPMVTDTSTTEVESVKSEPTPPESTKTVTPPKTNKPPTIKELRQQPNRKKLKQPNMGLISTGIIAVIVAIAAIVWFWLQPEIELASAPPTPEIVTNQETKPAPEIVNSPAINPETKTENQQPEPIIVSNSPTTPETTETEVEEDIPTNIPIPPDLTSPGRAKNLKIVTVEPELTFTPEQTLVAALQGKIVDLINQDQADIVHSVQVDLPTKSLLVEITDNWYELNESRQSKLANEILQRSRKLNFNKLELKDAQGTLVARNPVVGEQIIILQSNQQKSEVGS